MTKDHHRRFSSRACRTAAWTAAGLFAASTAIAEALPDRYAATDQLFGRVLSQVAANGLREELQIDHARLAEAAGKAMPAARVVLFTDPGVVTALVRSNVRAGLDLPLRVLAYEGEAGPAIAYTNAEFLRARHGLQDEAALKALDTALAKVLAPIEQSRMKAVPTSGMTRDQGIVELVSAYDFGETVDRLKKVVASQSDTVWFGEVDYQAMAAGQGTAIGPATLLLFGGPAPGGVAMAAFPSIGLDAFCQKLLVYQDDKGSVHVLFNSIVALAELHYGRSIDPHRMLDQRLTATFTKAIAPQGAP